MSTRNLEIFRCPCCAPEGNGKLAALRENWLGCSDCGRNYPVVKGIPVLIPDEGDKWQGTVADQLPDIEYYDRFT